MTGTPGNDTPLRKTHPLFDHKRIGVNCRDAVGEYVGVD